MTISAEMHFGVTRVSRDSAKPATEFTSVLYPRGIFTAVEYVMFAWQRGSGVRQREYRFSSRETTVNKILFTAGKIPIEITVVGRNFF